jgi:hypothetical protein
MPTRPMVRDGAVAEFATAMRVEFLSGVLRQGERLGDGLRVF